MDIYGAQGPAGGASKLVKVPEFDSFADFVSKFWTPFWSRSPDEFHPFTSDSQLKSSPFVHFGNQCSNTFHLKTLLLG